MSHFSRRRIVGSAFSLLGGFAVDAWPQSGWRPTRPVRMVLGYPPGGAADAFARDLLPPIERSLGQAVVLDYKPGAGGVIATEATASAEADGHTVTLLTNGPISIVPHARKVPYDPLRSFSYLGVVASYPLVLLVHPSLKVTTLDQFIGMLKKSPGAHSYSTSGLGTVHHMAAELLKARTGTYMVHIPYRGAAPAMNDLMSGEVKIAFTTVAAAVPVVQSNRAVAIGITSSQTVPALAGVRPFAEQGIPGFDAQGWFILAGPRGMAPEVTRELNQALNAALRTPSVLEKLTAQGNLVIPGPAAAAEKLVSADILQWGKVIREQRLQIE